MTGTISSVIVLAIMTATAVAQPGAKPASESPPSTPVIDANGVNLDELIARAEAEAPSIATVAKGTVRRARRSISIGPTVGLWSAAFISPGEIDAALSFGIGLETFKVPVMPSMETLQGLIVERVKAQLKDRITDLLKGQKPDPAELDRLVKQVYQDVRNEILGLENVRSKTMERPSLTVGFEANRLFGAARWLGRTRVGIGVWKFTLAISASVGRVCRGAQCDDGVKLFSGPEVVLHFLTSKNPRASVADVFFRADFQATGRNTTAYDQLVLGVRYLVDLL